MSDYIKLENFRAHVNLHVQNVMREQFSPSRYPYTYAADFLRAHPEMVPGHIRQKMVVIESRSDASQARSLWADELGIDDADAAEVLANAYLKENGVERVLAP
jgi:hypothetical protein